MNREQQLEKIKDVLLNYLSDNEMVYIHNNYCDKNRYYDDIIYFMNEFNDVVNPMSPLELIETYGDIDTSHPYFVFTIYGAESFNYYDNAPTTYYDEIAEYILDYDEDFGNNEIREVLDEILEEEE